MNVLMHNRHTPHAHMMITAMPDVHFDCLGWNGTFRPIPDNAKNVHGQCAGSYDVVIDDDPSLPTSIFNATKRVLLLHCEHDAGNRKSNEEIRDCVSSCDSVIFVSAHKRITHRDIAFSPKVSVIPFGLNVDTFPEIDHSSAIVGTMHNGLNLSVEIQEFAAYVLDSESVAIGYENTKSKTRTVTPTNHTELLRELSQVGIFVNIVCGESFGMSPCEAMACGIPVVTGNCIDAAEIAFDGWNICMPRLPALHAIDWIKDKIAQLKSDQALRKRIGSAGRETIRHLFNHHLLRERWMEVLS